MVYLFNFNRLEKKIKELKETDVMPGNQKQYFFLRYIVAKANKTEEYSFLEKKLKKLDGGEYIVQKTALILSKK